MAIPPITQKALFYFCLNDISSFIPFYVTNPWDENFLDNLTNEELIASWIYISDETIKDSFNRMGGVYRSIIEDHANMVLQQHKQKAT